MNDQQKRSEMFYYLTLKKNVSKKTGKPFWSAKYQYALDIMGFEKKDNSGDIVIMLSPKDMDELAKQREQPKNFAPRGNHPYAPKQTSPPPRYDGNDEGNEF